MIDQKIAISSLEIMTLFLGFGINTTQSFRIFLTYGIRILMNP